MKKIWREVVTAALITAAGEIAACIINMILKTKKHKKKEK
jgi:hypothetical protein